MATHSSVLAWRIPGMGEPDGLLTMVLHSWTQLKQLSSSSSNTTKHPTMNKTAPHPNHSQELFDPKF